ncbi:amidase [Bosea sp. (in: a-proteobacteria)]|uniref:amidase n=1 Tax=Bosea sp. (in: a-proteobacteria) TaxID=1871050 RepID=UPI0025BBFF1B|nr:amidase [Bosea sp. (in: a-proteobacteria)]
MADTEYWQQDAAGLARLLDAGAVTPSDLLEMYLERCERLEPVLNAFFYLDRRGARRSAAEATERQRSGRRLGPLDGIPVSVKDNLYVAGMPASWGSLMFQEHIPERDDICVERLRKAGAVILGKTTTPEFALMGRTENRLTGVTRNPWDPALTPGGSSGGAVAAVAAGLVPLSVGTDAGGSTRMPAGYTGLVGLRPSNGRVPRCYGFPPMALDFQAIGPICRTMADLDLMLAVMAGADHRDPASLNLPPLVAPSRPLRIGWFVAIGEETVDKEVAESHREAREALAALGHQLVECEPPFDLAELRALWDTLTPVGAARVASLKPGWETDATAQIVDLTRQGLGMPAVEYVRAIDRLQAFRRETSSQWGGYDALLIPTAAAPAWAADLDAPPTIAGRPGNGATQGMFCGWVNAMGYCGLNVPGRQHPDGRPIGLQIVAPFGLDGIAIDIGRQLERALPWSERWPDLAISPR